jgi:AcrR family transcriptional regulator
VSSLPSPSIPGDATRRAEILDIAAALIASSGVRTSLHQIAAACGILPGSLYHHFESKEAIIDELVHRYLDDLDRLAAHALDLLHEPEVQPVEEQVLEFGQSIADCAVRHRAALLLTLYEPPTASSEVLARLAQTPRAIDATMLEILRAGQVTGAIRPGVDVALLAERICQSTLHTGVGVYHRSARAQAVPALRCRILLNGLVARTPAEATLDRSEAMRAAGRVVASWDDQVDGDRRVARLREAARAVFGRRGFEAATMRDVAAAAGVSTGSVYRLYPSKDELLLAVMQRFIANVSALWDTVMGSASPPVERLDALMWGNVNVVDRFSEEFRIQLAWLRQSPPTTTDLGSSFGRQVRQMEALLADGRGSGQLRPEPAPLDVWARSVIELVWMPETIVRPAGVAAAHHLMRETVLRGAVAPSHPAG